MESSVRSRGERTRPCPFVFGLFKHVGIQEVNMAATLVAAESGSIAMVIARVLFSRSRAVTAGRGAWSAGDVTEESPRGLSPSSPRAALLGR